MIKPLKAWRMRRARKHNAVYLIDSKGRLLNPRVVLTDPRFEIEQYKDPFLLVSSPATRPPTGFEYTWDELLAGHPDKAGIMESLGLVQEEHDE